MSVKAVKQQLNHPDTMNAVADQDPATDHAIINALLASGFPFQTAISDSVRQMPNCRVEAEEFPWRDGNGADHFLDLVIVNFIVTIECKKTQKEIFTFLQPSTSTQEHVIRARCLYLHQINDSSKRLELSCGDWEIRPRSIESVFCVVSTSDSGKDQRLLEKDAQLLVGGTDAYGRFLKPEAQNELGKPDRVIIPVIATNAKLFKADYNPNDVSLETGQMPKVPPPDISPVKCVRFRKAFSAASRDVGDRTVFVIAAASLRDFLNNLEYIPLAPSPQNPIRFPAAP